MIKLQTAEWLAAEQENKAIRDRLRKQFWSEIGVTPAKNTTDIDIPEASRLGFMQSLVEKTINGKESDREMKRITTLAVGEVASLAIGTFGHGGLRAAPDMARLAPKQLRNFFRTQEKTSYEWAEFGTAR
jgi:hypothetical protein